MNIDCRKTPCLFLTTERRGRGGGGGVRYKLLTYKVVKGVSKVDDI